MSVCMTITGTAIARLVRDNYTKSICRLIRRLVACRLVCNPVLAQIADIPVVVLEKPPDLGQSHQHLRSNCCVKTFSAHSTKLESSRAK